MTAHHRLRAFLRWRTLTLAEASDRLGCSKSMVSMLCTGTRRPSLDLATSIETLTASWPLGPIRCHEWASEPKARDRAA